MLLQHDGEAALVNPMGSGRLTVTRKMSVCLERGRKGGRKFLSANHHQIIVGFTMISTAELPLFNKNAAPKMDLPWVFLAHKVKLTW
jgi:hypothetical protein